MSVSSATRLFSYAQSLVRTRVAYQVYAFHAVKTQRRRCDTSNCAKGIHTVTRPLRVEEKVAVHFIDRDGKKLSVKACDGDSFLDVVVNQKLDIDGFGACEGTLACSTCHLIFEQATYEQLGQIADEEMDMLDLAYGLTDTSRLGCQVCLSTALDGVTVRVPEAVSDARNKAGSSLP